MRAFRSIAVAIALLAAAATFAEAAAPTVAELDATQRAAGNRIDLATAIGRSVFTTTWPAQVTQISANAVGRHLVIGIRLWGVKFHHPLTRAEFAGEIAALVRRAFAAAPAAEEVDVWASVPVVLGKDVVVSGDLAIPTTKTVFSLSVRRGEPSPSVTARALRGPGAYWNQEWAAAAFQKQST